MSQDDGRHMAHALALSRRGLGRVWPNPSVGCVIVKDGVVVGRGVTAPGGRPHAEPQALAMAGAAARGATAYVTLEPCAHHGKTPPCANALVAAGVARVVSALQDPDPRVSGGGHAILRAAGIVVTTGVMEAEARAVQQGFLSRITLGRPMLTLKLALSVDGRIATASGESRWITGPEARARVHLMRASHDAVLVGGGTARADDPELTVRGLGIGAQPVRIVAASRLDLPRGGRMEAAIAHGPFWLVHGRDAPEEARAYWAARGARLIGCRAGAGGLDAGALMQALGAEGLTRVFCEGGGQFAAALVGAGLVDRLEVFGAGLLLGADGRAGLGVLGHERLAEAPRFRLVSVGTVGADVWQSWAQG
ncbi:MAG: bifunctional diaminohydroxyphosphoribosylaminopyrimidine deaminase/5-amino-6-(5-phosphoribosylamino)uracil reductase RibD [Rhodobacterales bacterium]|nr:bifunctional diaminohydroxyphosphoribosylaminopyrimidine deaminase/5-amino-6-(5-phosphoribosylamino)uracil reductase RibD [Rhodobacterales bacterium]MDX5500099.1 bifunctional diaminohydroxyphosphoribosylaminopyrimidine deaminase/5-amino-6-(5-phosphoribosylamino)uracil reductase RibD [Rhodobacterales bacterium]